jgi:hypothetical protein
MEMGMPYVKRNAEGLIDWVSRVPVEGAEALPDDDPRVQTFLAGFGGANQQLRDSDLELVRVLEDLVELLVRKGVILFTELPESAQEKMRFRQQLRSRMAGALDLLADD